ncbi:hypothetical protein LguiB_024235 [Lonicera macranthoides]
MESSANTCFLDLEHCSYFSHNFSLGIPIEVKTADTGYMSRRLIKALEDLSVHYDNTVRNASTSIVQFTYGDDGMDPAQMEGKSGFPLNFDRLISKVKATCPAGENMGKSPSEILRAVDERSQSTRRELKLDEGQLTAGEELKLLENIAQNISGSTPRQLETWCTICLRPYEARILLKSPVGCELVAAPIRTQEES